MSRDVQATVRRRRELRLEDERLQERPVVSTRLEPRVGQPAGDQARGAYALLRPGPPPGVVRSGEDVDGVAFKLSDYRGKVVVLDYWGFW